jgi:hypothetical protein
MPFLSRHLSTLLKAAKPKWRKKKNPKAANPNERKLQQRPCAVNALFFKCFPANAAGGHCRHVTKRRLLTLHSGLFCDDSYTLYNTGSREHSAPDGRA